MVLEVWDEGVEGEGDGSKGGETRRTREEEDTATLMILT